MEKSPSEAMAGIAEDIGTQHTKGIERKSCLKSPAKKKLHMEGSDEIPEGIVRSNVSMFGSESHNTETASASSGHAGSGQVGGPPGLEEAEAANNEAAKGKRTAQDMKEAGGLSGMDLKDMLQRIDNNVVSLRTEVRESLEQVRAEVQEIKKDMVNKEMFGSLEARVQKLESGGVACSQLSWLKEQINKLDPCNKCLSVNGFKDENVGGRVACIEKIFKDYFPEVNILSVDHIYKGPRDDRSLTGTSIIELSSRSARELVLKKFQGGLSLQDSSATVLKVSRAKSALQLRRNANLRRALAALQKDPLGKDKKIEIEWQVEGGSSKDRCKDRSVKMNEEVVFLQKVDDDCGIFSPQFAHLTW